MILAFDYSQIELRVLAHNANDQKLISALKEERDIHTQTAMDVFDVETDQVDDLLRRQAKAVNFGIVYGISDYGLSQNLKKIGRASCRERVEISVLALALDNEEYRG